MYTTCFAQTLNCLHNKKKKSFSLIKPDHCRYKILADFLEYLSFKTL